MHKLINKNLSRKMLFSLFFGLMISIFVFIFFNWLLGGLLDDYLNTSDYIYRAQQTSIQNFTSYVNENCVPADDTILLHKWAKKYGVRRLLISREGTLVYDSAYPDKIDLSIASTEYSSWSSLHYHTVQFADGDADVYIDKNYTTPIYLAFYITLAGACVLLWMGIFVHSIHREVRYIQKLRQAVSDIEDEKMDGEIIANGEDELRDLARGLIHMRSALIEKRQAQKQMEESRTLLAMGMTHDLRTPLTALTTFLDLAKNQKSMSDASEYIEGAYARVEQIDRLASELLEFFLIQSVTGVELEAAAPAEYAIGDFLYEYYALLKEEGFHVCISDVEWGDEKTLLRVHTPYIERIVDNMFSNMCKYADKEKPVIFSSGQNDDSFWFTIENSSIDKHLLPRGTGIGTKNITNMMKQMYGRCEIELDEEKAIYRLCLIFPIVKIS